MRPNSSRTTTAEAVEAVGIVLLHLMVIGGGIYWLLA